MEDLITVLKKTREESLLEQLSEKELQEARFLFEALAKEAEAKIREMSKKEETPSDYIELVFDGRPDLIKRDIKVLNLSCNNYTTLPEEIYQLKHLTKLYLYSNKFTQEEKVNIRRRFPLKVEIQF